MEGKEERENGNKSKAFKYTAGPRDALAYMSCERNVRQGRNACASSRMSIVQW